jgi:hypothetical protein
MKILLLTLFIIVTFFGGGVCQPGGEGVYKFLGLTNSARVAALGGTQIAFADNDLNLTFYNPSLLSDSMRNQLSVNYVSYMAGIGVGYAAFTPELKGRNAFAAGIHFINYGAFEGASETGELTGSFRAAEYALNLYYSRILTSRLKIGINLKPIFSSFESYHSVGLAADLGITYVSDDQHSAIALVLKDLGSQLTTYYDNGKREPLLPNLQLGFTQRLNQAPVRFYATLDHLNNWNLAYEYLSGNKPLLQSENLTSTLMRHLILGGEIYPGQHVTLRFGYNYRRQKELAADTRPGLVGFSAGLGVKISKFNLNYGIASYHLAATAHYFSLSTNLSQFIH